MAVPINPETKSAKDMEYAKKKKGIKLVEVI